MFLRVYECSLLPLYLLDPPLYSSYFITVKLTFFPFLNICSRNGGPHVLLSPMYCTYVVFGCHCIPKKRSSYEKHPLGNLTSSNFFWAIFHRHERGGVRFDHGGQGIRTTRTRNNFVLRQVVPAISYLDFTGLLVQVVPVQ